MFEKPNIMREIMFDNSNTTYLTQRSISKSRIALAQFS